MSENTNQPKEYDAVLGGQNPPPINAAVLGGIEGVKKRLASPVVELRIHALSEALKYGEQGLDLVLQAAQDQSIEVKNAACSLLKGIKDISVLGGIEVIKKCLASPVVELRIHALSDALKYGEQGLDLVLQAVQDQTGSVYAAACSLLKDIKDISVLGGIEVVKKYLASPVVELRINALSEAIKYGEQGLDLVLLALQDKSVEVRIKALSEAIKYGEQGLDLVLLALQDKSVEVRIKALSEAIKYGERGLDLVLPALQDESIEVQFAAYSLLKDRQEEKVKQQLDNWLPLFEFEVVTVDAFGQINSRRRHSARYFTEDLGNGVGLEMVAIPGETQIGSLLKDVHPEVYAPEVIKPFFMSKYPITQEQWEAVMGDNPSHFKGAKRPVENVSLDGAGSFCGRLREKTGKGYRLPSKRQWIYACRAGTTTPFYFGETITPDLVNYNGQETTPVGTFPPNAFGLYDMHGNVREVSWDTRTDSNPFNGNDTRYRIVCGGSWGDKAESCRSASDDQIYEAYIYGIGTNVDSNYAVNQGSLIGFRVVWFQ